MKITLLTPALVAILGLALAGATLTAQAQTTNTPAAAKPSESTKVTKIHYRGKITAIDASSITVTNSVKILTLAIAPTTTFKKADALATVADFAVGDKVAGTYTKDPTGAMTACTVNKKAAK